MKYLRKMLLLSLLLTAVMPLSASYAYFYYRTYPAPNYPAYYYPSSGVVTYPYHYPGNVVVYPATTTTRTYWYNPRPYHYYGARPCFVTATGHVACW